MDGICKSATAIFAISAVLCGVTASADSAPDSSIEGIIEVDSSVPFERLYIAAIEPDEEIAKDIPDAVWEPIYFRSINEVTERAGITPLRDAVPESRDTEIRIWSGFGTLPLKGIVIEHKDDSWGAVFVRSIYSHETEAWEAEVRELEPSIPWETLMSQLARHELFTLPDAYTLDGYPFTVFDGTSYVVEIARQNRYRTYQYGNPGRHDVHEARQLSRAVRLIDEIFSVSLFQTPTSFPEIVTDGQVVLVRKGDAFGAFRIFVHARTDQEEGRPLYPAGVKWAYRDDGRSIMSGASLVTGEHSILEGDPIEFGPFSIRWSPGGIGRAYIRYPDPYGERPDDPDRQFIAITNRHDFDRLDAADERWVYRSGFLDFSPHFLTDVLSKIEENIQELGLTEVSSRSPSAWHGDAQVTGTFYLRDNPRYHADSSGRPSAERTPIPDLEIDLVRFANDRAASQAVEQSLWLRPAIADKMQYKGATLYRYSSGWGSIICQQGHYAIEIRPRIEGVQPLTMSVLDFLLDELPPSGTDDTSPK